MSQINMMLENKYVTTATSNDILADRDAAGSMGHSLGNTSNHTSCWECRFSPRTSSSLLTSGNNFFYQRNCWQLSMTSICQLHLSSPAPSVNTPLSHASEITPKKILQDWSGPAACLLFANHEVFDHGTLRQ